jgi:ribokinase
MAGSVVVVGSLSMDLVVQAPRRPERGETLRGTGFGMFAGGKGNNQALAASRSGARTAMIGRVGCDAFGEQLLKVLRENRIDVSGMVRDADVPTGIAHITVDASGNNYIVIAQQSNAELCAADIERAADLIKQSKVLLMQLEVPYEPLIAAAKMAQEAGLKVILNPAPAPESGSIPKELLKYVDIIVPNQTEAKQLTAVDAEKLEGAKEAAKVFKSWGIATTILTLGELGALVLDGGEAAVHVPAFKVKAIDTTAAGDAFCGAFAAGLADGRSLSDAVKLGSAAGALATTKLGAEPSLPTRDEIDGLMALATV